ncbi:MAG: hypothetical protein RIR26_1209 [Pseudomonadota bacterium]
MTDLKFLHPIFSSLFRHRLNSPSQEDVFIRCKDKNDNGKKLPQTFPDGTVVRSDGQWVRVDSQLNHIFYRVGKPFRIDGRRVTVVEHSFFPHNPLRLCAVVCAVIAVLFFLKKGEVATPAPISNSKEFENETRKLDQGTAYSSPASGLNIRPPQAEVSGRVNLGRTKTRNFSSGTAQHPLQLNPFRCRKITGAQVSSTDKNPRSRETLKTSEEMWYVCR